MVVGQRVQIDVGERVAVDDVERFIWQQGQCLARTAGGAEDGRLEGVADADAEIASVADMRRNRLRHVMQVQHEVADAPLRAVLQKAAHKRIAGDGHCRFRANV
jgi:hypothetical protein